VEVLRYSQAQGFTDIGEADAENLGEHQLLPLMMLMLIMLVYLEGSIGAVTKMSVYI
jgi:hypothetical protein